MPELPEVQTVVTSLNARILGRTIASAELVRTDILTPPGVPLPALLTGRRIAKIDRRGKKIVFTLDDDSRFYIHLGMSGRLTVADPTTPLPDHTHFRTRFADSAIDELRFTDPRRFGGIWWLGKTGAIDADLGPEPLTLRPAQLARLLAKTTRAIKTALLDQKLLAGLGNIYADEALHEAGINPRTPANRLTPPECSRLSRAIKKVLRRAIRHKGSTLRDYRTPAGDEGKFQHLHRVYARAHLPCLTCKSKSKITRIVLGGRSTHYCPTCQPPSFDHATPG
jgi:formamidopyrimidine-DNA glycosylase